MTAPHTFRGHCTRKATAQHCVRSYGPPGPAKLMSRAVRLQQKYDNRAGAVDVAYKTSTAKSETTVKEVTVTNRVAVGLETGFKAFGADIKISATYEYTNVRQRPELCWLRTTLTLMHQLPYNASTLALATWLGPSAAPTSAPVKHLLRPWCFCFGRAGTHGRHYHYQRGRGGGQRQCSCRQVFRASCGQEGVRKALPSQASSAQSDVLCLLVSACLGATPARS